MIRQDRYLSYALPQVLTMTSSVLWRPDTDQSRPPLVSGEVYRPDILAVIERTIDDLRPALRALSDKIHGASSTRSPVPVVSA